MKRSTAIIVTIITTLACGLPSMILLCLGAFAMLGTQMPEVMAENPGSTTEEVMFGAGILICFGAVLLVIPLLVGVFSFQMSKPEDPAMNEFVPPNF